MKKSTLALAVAAALVGFGSTAYADTTLYGSARVSVDYDNINSRFDVEDDSLDIFNNASRLGVRGEEDLGGGLSAIYQYEFGVDVTEGGNFNEASSRPKWVGLKGGWGSLTLGTHWTPYYNVIGVGDVFNSSKVFDNDTYLGNTFGLRMDNSLVYKTPSWSGFGLEAMVVANGQVNGTRSIDVNDDVDMWNIAASYKNGPFFVGATYMSREGNDPLGTPLASRTDSDQWGVAFGYNAPVFGITLAYENGDLNALNRFRYTENIYLTGRYTFGNNILRAAYGYSNPDSSIATDAQAVRVGLPAASRQGEANNWVVGYEYDFSKRTRVWVEYLNSDYDNGVADRETLSIGTRHDF